MVSSSFKFNLKSLHLRKAFAARIKNAKSPADILQFFKNNPRFSKTSLQGIDMLLTLLMTSPRLAAFLHITPPQLRLLMIAAPALQFIIRQMMKRKSR